MISGTYGCLLAILTGDLVGVENIGPAFGCLLTMAGLGAGIGTPAGGKNIVRQH